MSGFFGVLRDSSDSEEEGGNDATVTRKVSKSGASNKVVIPSYEDLSTSRADEETVLQAVYGDDFRRYDGAWGCAKLEVNVQPPDIEPIRIGSKLCLSVQVGKQYPYVPPTIVLRNVQGLSKDEQSQLMGQLRDRSIELAQSGSVMIIELVQVVEDFLVDHNCDPTMSAWEQMKAREVREKEKERKVQEDLNQLMNASKRAAAMSPLSSITRENFSDVPQSTPCPASKDIERELFRQKQALDTAKRARRGETASSSTQGKDSNELEDDDDEDDEDEDDDDDDFAFLEEDGNLVSQLSSRYMSDFIELGVLGRGGGGEVVKVRNRLDRRIYAVKKIILESGRGGRFLNYAAQQNRKLFREVTTISRMTHKNIVRYYQAWIDAGSKQLEKQEDNQPNASTIDNDDDDDNDESVVSAGGFWANSPPQGNQTMPLLDEKTDGSFDSNITASESGESSTSNSTSGFGGSDLAGHVTTGLAKKNLHSDSMINLLEHENDYDFQSPLLTGLGFQGQMYDGLISRKTLKKSEQLLQDSESDTFDDSSVKVGNGDGKTVLYIQMEYCSTTLRKLIDDRKMEKMEEIEKWRLVGQILEALVYIHGRNIIHRDLKPGNVFLDSEGNIKLGDFGLATTHRESSSNEENDSKSESEKVYDAIDDISRLMGGPAISTSMASGMTSCNESMTGGVGTTFYRAPEQEGTATRERAYTVQADMFSLGVTLFEMFHPPFETYMERAETLTILRGDFLSKDRFSSQRGKGNGDDIKVQAAVRFPPSFVESTPLNAQRIILWCLEREPTKRPSAEELLTSDLLPRKIELEQRYLEEALEILTSPQSESYLQILEALFQRPTTDIVELTFDTDVAARANTLYHEREGTELRSLFDDLLRAISDIRTGAANEFSYGSLAMSKSSLAAATSTLRRAKHAGKVGRTGKGMLKRATQRTSGIFAMRAATAAAITGALDGVHGADPKVVEGVCESMKSIFEMHGAARLRSPLLRPRPNHVSTTALGGVAELINRRGTILLLPEDLTAPVARAIARGGSATSHFKRYEIDRVFHKSMTGGHPRESLEASFDVVYEDASRGDMIEAETILVASEALSILPSRPVTLNKIAVSKSPLWYIRLNHTRLADAVLDLCGIPQKEALRRACFHILTRFTSCAPGTILESLHKNSKKSSRVQKAIHLEESGRLLHEAVKDFGMPTHSVEKLLKFVECCYPPSPDINVSIEAMKKALAVLQNLTLETPDLKTRRRFEVAAKSLRSVKDLIEVLESLELKPYVGHADADTTNRSRCRPLYISWDLGLRQRRKHYHGGTIFQCIVLTDNFFETLPDVVESHDILISQSGRGIKIAEGGNYSDLVRKNRLPGNFADVLVDQYTAVLVPACAGVRFSIGKFVELIYLHATFSGQSTQTDGWAQNDTENHERVDALRRSLGYPLTFSRSVDCIVAGVQGMDAAGLPSRFLVAARLWSEGVSAEYLPQSNVMLSIARRLNNDHEDGASDWSLLELYGVCALLKIPFLVIVQPHLLKDKRSVRLRPVQFDSNSSQAFSTLTNNNGEIIVSLENLATTIVGATSNSSTVKENQSSTSPGLQMPTARESRHLDVECIYVDNDQYFGNDREPQKSETPLWKSYKKVMKTIVYNASSYLSSFNDASKLAAMGLPYIPVFAVADVSFWVLRDFGTAFMRRERQEQSASGACQEMIEKFPKHKRPLKTLGVAIDNFMKRFGIWKSSGSGADAVSTSLPLKRDASGGASTLITALLYSKIDDRFDMISLHQGKSPQHGGQSLHSTTGSNNSHGKRRH